jgi:hypothetical protein
MVTPSEKDGYDELDRQKRSEKQSQLGGQLQVGSGKWQAEGAEYRAVRNKANWQ